MVNIIEENRPVSIGQRFAQAFRGAGEALPEALGNLEKAIKDKKLQIAKKKAKVRPEMKSFLSLYDKNKAFNADMISNLEELTHKYVEQGFEPSEAVSSAYNDVLSKSEQEGQAQQKQAEEKGGFFGAGKESFRYSFRSMGKDERGSLQDWEKGNSTCGFPFSSG